MNKKDENQLLCFAIVVGCVRFCRKRAARGSPADSLQFAKEHLSHPDFESLSETLRAFAESKISALLEAVGTARDHSAFISDVARGRHERCWEAALQALGSRGTGDNRPIRREIRPGWLI